MACGLEWRGGVVSSRVSASIVGPEAESQGPPLPLRRQGIIFASVNLALLALLGPALLAGFILADPDRLGPVAARVVMIAFGLAALGLGAGTLVPAAVADYAAGGPDPGLFVSVTLGLMIGAVAPWPFAGWRRWAGGVPLVVALLLPSLGHLQPLPLLLGAVLGATPLLLGGAVPRLSEVKRPRPRGVDSRWWAMAVLLVLVALAPVLVVALQVPVLALGLTMVGVRRGRWSRHAVVLPALATVIALALVGVAVHSSGDPWLRPDSVSRSAGLLSADARLAGGLAVLLLVALVAPWPLHRLGPGTVLLPAAVVLGVRMAWSLVPVGLVGWAPAMGLLLVPSAVIAAWHGRWAVALATLAIVPVAAAGPWAQAAMAGAVLAALAATRLPNDGERGGGVTFPRERWVAASTALGICGMVAVVLPDEVVLATVLAAGCAAAASRRRPVRSSA